MIPVVWWLASTASAGGGPWVQHTEQASVYLGTESQKFEQFILSDGNFGDTEPVQVDDGISKILVKAIVTYGLTPRSEVELSVPYGDVRANRDLGSDSVCATLGLDACAPNQGLAPITVRAKMNFLEQAYGPPVSASAGIELRYEHHTLAERAQLTSLGEGTFDAGIVLSAGRSSSLPGSGYYYTYLEALGRYRVPTTTLKGTSSPGSELQLIGDLVVVPDGRIGFGPTIVMFDRPVGLDFEETILTDVDRFAALRVRNYQAGAKLTLSASPKASASLSVLRSLYAVNNPLITGVSFGLSFSDVLPKKTVETEE